jgi:hypothetical protein
LRVEALQRVDVKPLRRRQGTPLAAFSTGPLRIREILKLSFIESLIEAYSKFSRKHLSNMILP